MNKRRKAISCKLVRPSNSNPGYFKYEVAIEEKDGRINLHPAYGKDMQDALSRLIKKEVTDKLEKRFFHAGYIFILWLVLMGWPLLLMPNIEKTPMYMVYSFGSIALAIALTAIWYNHINKK